MSILYLTELIDAINKCTSTLPGITRQSFGWLETKAMRVVANRAEEHGLRIEWDHAGNLHCIKPGTLPEIITGSHLDSVPNGGRYDGVAGVVAGLCAIVNSNTPRQLRLIVFRGEESAWYGRCYLGSSMIFDMPDLATLELECDGRTLDSAFGALVTDGSCFPHLTHKFTAENTLRFIEVHIEQGPVLHDAGHPIGIVSSIRGNWRYPEVKITGQAGHSGTTPMKGRRDAVMGFVELMHRLERHLLVEFPQMVMTCGIVGTDSSKHAMSVIPDEVKFALEFRGEVLGDILAFDKRFHEMATDYVCSARRLSIFFGQNRITAPVPLDVDLRQHLGRIANLQCERAIPVLPSGAGHDAAVWQSHGIPTGMVFVRNDKGSHNPDEAMDVADLLIATNVLREAMCE